MLFNPIIDLFPNLSMFVGGTISERALKRQLPSPMVGAAYEKRMLGLLGAKEGRLI
jgi:hypothetical protein